MVGLFRGRLAPLKTLTLVMFVMMTGISNQQSYSFMGLVDGALMMMLGLGVVAVVQTLLSPFRPEQSPAEQCSPFLSRLRTGCRRILLGWPRRTRPRAMAPQTVL